MTRKELGKSKSKGFPGEDAGDVKKGLKIE